MRHLREDESGRRDRDESSASARDEADAAHHASLRGGREPLELRHSTAASLRQAAVLRMQRTQGNRSVAQLLVQRKTDDPGSPGAPPATPTPGAPPAAASAAASALIVEDAATELEPGQMRKSEFLAQARTAVNSTVDQALAGSSWGVVARPQIDGEVEKWHATYRGQDALSVERALRQQVPAATGAKSAAALIQPLCDHVRTTIQARLPKSEGLTGVVGAAASAVSSAVSSVAQGIGNAISSVGNLLFKARGAAAPGAEEPGAIQAQLGPGQPLDGRVRTGMEAALGQGFSHVQVHRDAAAATLADNLDARAFAVGPHIAFGAGEYQPGTPVGDALIAHELAHVAQQRGAPVSGVMPKGGEDTTALEEDADVAAVSAVAFLWGGTKRLMANVGANTAPALRSGLKLQRCSKSAEPKTRDERLLKFANDGDWKGFFSEFNGMSEAEQRTFLRANPWAVESIRIRLYAAGSEADQERIRALLAGMTGSAAAAYDDAVAGGKWGEAVKQLRSMSDGDINSRLKKLSKDQLNALRQAAGSDVRDRLVSVINVFVASDPANTMNAKELYQTWMQFWVRKFNEAVEHRQFLDKKLHDANVQEYADKKYLFDKGKRDALGPEYEQATNREATLQNLLQIKEVHDWLETYVDNMGRRVTFEEINQKALEIARTKAWFREWVHPIIYAVLGEASGPRPGGAGRGGVPEEAPTEAPKVPGACFLAGTEIRTPTGARAIESLAVGDMAIAVDVTSGGQAGQRIGTTFSRTVPTIVELHVGDSVIRCTPEHPFWVPGTGWCNAGALEPGVQLLTAEGARPSVDAVEQFDGSYTVYNIEVEGFHTYCVSPLGIVVHNKGMGGRLGGRIPEWRGTLRSWRNRLTDRQGPKWDKLRGEADDLAKKVDELDKSYDKAETKGNEAEIKRLENEADKLGRRVADFDYDAARLGEMQGGKRFFPEESLLGSGKHGVNWSEGQARAIKEHTDQGKFGSALDVDYAVQVAGTLSEAQAGTGTIVGLRPGSHSSIVYEANTGNVVPATQMYVKAYPSGKVHAYPLK